MYPQLYLYIHQHAIATIKTSAGLKSSEEISSLISTPRPDDEATPLHVASFHGHADVVRTLLVNIFKYT